MPPQGCVSSGSSLAGRSRKLRLSALLPSRRTAPACVTPDRAPYAIRYYEALTQRADTVYSLSPLGRGAADVPFSFDDSYNWRPLGYRRPGPKVVIYKLRGGRCGA